MACNQHFMTFPKADKQVKTVRDLLPVHEHPHPGAIRSIYTCARNQMRDLHTDFSDSNLKARLIRSNLTPEQLYIYEWIGYIFTIIALPHEIFARQVGVSVQTLKHWLKRKGHLPGRLRFRRLLAIYQTNFCDELAAELLHGEKIGQWRRAYRPIWEEERFKPKKKEEYNYYDEEE